MSKKSAGILLYRKRNERLEVLLLHPGGPFWKNKDLGAWTIPKGEFDEDEDPAEAARREFEEETGQPLDAPMRALNPVRQGSGKTVYAWAVQGEFDPETLKSNLFELEWPPSSGKMATFPEVDKAQWFSLEEAELKILKGQKDLLKQLADASSVDGSIGVNS